MAFPVQGARVVITGAASGLGYGFAEQAVLGGAHSVVLWDVNEQGLVEATERLQALAQRHGHPAVFEHTALDLANFEAVDAAAASVLAGGVPDLVINNAGIVRGNSYAWEADTRTVALPTLMVNTVAPIHVVRTLLPAMIEDRGREKRLLTVASAAALVSNPRMSAYAASKWAAYAYSDTVRLELRNAGHRHVKVTTFCPSYISTGLFAGARGMFLTPVITPEHAVRSAWRAMLRGKAVQRTPYGVTLGRVLKGILPQRVWDRVAASLGVYRSMEAFTGRPTPTDGGAK